MKNIIILTAMTRLSLCNRKKTLFTITSLIPTELSNILVSLHLESIKKRKIRFLSKDLLLNQNETSVLRGQQLLKIKLLASVLELGVHYNYV